MPAMLAQQADAYPTPPDSSQPIEPARPLDMHYYLTEGLEGVEHHEYHDIRSFKGAVDSRSDAMCLGKADEFLPPYLILSPVTPRQLANIDQVRKTRYKNLRILYLNEPKTLIVKHMPGPVHEMVTSRFVYTIWKKIDEGGQLAEIACMGSTTYQGKLCCKEADGSFRPLRARPDQYDWPTVILECGVTESPRRLTADARWWFENSEDAVKITRGNDHREVTGPILKRLINITAESITGAPLKLRFKDIFLRKHKNERGEGNYIITEHDLRDYYNMIWPPEPEAGSEGGYSTHEGSQSSSSSEGFVVD
ncbi:hypothetical protein HOY82DRAFT_669170 [Tuber indicum]|nr:hypothetical protein HOY82DRAFT_669170 [Tuber indicum]